MSEIAEVLRALKYCLPRQEEILLHDRVVAEYNYMIRPIKPRKKKEKVNENKLVD